MENVLEITGLTKSYGDFSLKEMNLAVPQGCIMGFIGQNGAGKTTTIQLILDIIKRDTGNIKVFGMDNIEKGSHIKEQIGVVFDEMGYHDFLMPVHINSMMKNIYENWQEDTFYKYLEEFGLPKKKKCGSFSRGMRMKLQIAVALSHQAKLLIMDEPTSGLDPVVRNEILQIFQEFVMEEDHTILLSSHIIGDLERIADMITFIDRGKILLSGNKEDILEKHGMMKCTKDDVSRIEKKDIVCVRQSAFETEVMVSDRKLCSNKYPDLLIESASLEEIMLFYVEKNRRNQ